MHINENNTYVYVDLRIEIAQIAEISVDNDNNKLLIFYNLAVISLSVKLLSCGTGSILLP
jgi:hypothetical protein